MISKDKMILIVGLGLIGGSYAMKLSQLGYNVRAIDIDKAALEFAFSNALIDNEGLTNEELITSSDIIILGLYPLTSISWVRENKHLFKGDVILTDVSGVKTNYVDVIQKELKAPQEFISVHPMAGKEKSGVYHADCAIFENANYIIITTPLNSDKGIEFARDLGKLLNFRNIEVLDPSSHDEMISFLSQLPHAIAVSLMNCHDNESLHRFSGDSFKDLTRIAKINENLWSELFFLNKDALVKDIDDFTKTLLDLKEKVINEDSEGLKKLFKESTSRRRSFEK